MKTKHFLIFITILLLICQLGCTKSGKSNKIVTQNTTQIIYYSFEEKMAFSNEAVLAKCEKIHYYPEGYCWIEFEVEKRYFGEESNENIFIYHDTSINEIKEYDYSYEISDVLYEEGKKYFLILSRFINPVTENHNEYGSLIDLIPYDDIASKSLYYGKTPDECEDELFRELTKSVESIDAYLDNYDASANLLYRGRKLIEVDDEAIIVEGSDYILRVKIERTKMEEFSKNKDIFECSVVDPIKGNFEKGWELTILFPKNLVSLGEEYIVALNYICDETEKDDLPEPQNHWMLAPSSLKVTLSLTEEEIMAILNGRMGE